MTITQTDLNLMRIASAGVQSTGEILRDLIRDHKNSPEYEDAKQGEAYYRTHNDIYDHDFRVEFIEETDTGANGDLTHNIVKFTNKNRSNHRAANGFFRVHVKQKTEYILGKEPSISVSGSDGNTELEEYRDALASTTNYSFNEAVSNLETRASRNGKAFLKEYKGRDGQLKQAVIGFLNGIPIYDTAHQNELVEFIYFYDVVVHLNRSTKITRTFAEWWAADGVTYWFSDEEGGAFHPDPDRPGVQPHFYEVTMGYAADGVTPVEIGRVPKTWGRLPIIELQNNEDGMTDLAPYKDLIDAYDLLMSAGTNNLLDFNEFYAVIQGLNGSSASEIVRKLRVNHAVAVGSAGNNGNIELKQLALEMQGRIDWLTLLRNAIHEYGMAVDINRASNLGSAPSGVSLKFQFTLLDLKANEAIKGLTKAILTHFYFVTQDINRRENKAYDPSLIDVTFNKSLITNDAELVSMITQSTELVPERILLAAHPLVTDPDAAIQEMEEQRKRKAKDQQKLFGTFGRPDEKEDDDA